MIHIASGVVIDLLFIALHVMVAQSLTVRSGPVYPWRSSPHLTREREDRTLGSRQPSLPKDTKTGAFHPKNPYDDPRPRAHSTTRTGCPPISNPFTNLLSVDLQSFGSTPPSETRAHPALPSHHPCAVRGPTSPPRLTLVRSFLSKTAGWMASMIRRINPMDDETALHRYDAAAEIALLNMACEADPNVVDQHIISAMAGGEAAIENITLFGNNANPGGGGYLIMKGLPKSSNLDNVRSLTKDDALSLAERTFDQWGLTGFLNMETLKCRENGDEKCTWQVIIPPARPPFTCSVLHYIQPQTPAKTQSPTNVQITVEMDTAAPTDRLAAALSLFSFKWATCGEVDHPAGLGLSVTAGGRHIATRPRLILPAASNSESARTTNKGDFLIICEGLQSDTKPGCETVRQGMADLRWDALRSLAASTCSRQQEYGGGENMMSNVISLSIHFPAHYIYIKCIHDRQVTVSLSHWPTTGLAEETTPIAAGGAAAVERTLWPEPMDTDGGAVVPPDPLLIEEVEAAPSATSVATRAAEQIAGAAIIGSRPEETREELQEILLLGGAMAENLGNPFLVMGDIRIWDAPNRFAKYGTNNAYQVGVHINYEGTPPLLSARCLTNEHIFSLHDCNTMSETHDYLSLSLLYTQVEAAHPLWASSFPGHADITLSSGVHIVIGKLGVDPSLKESSILLELHQDSSRMFHSPEAAVDKVVTGLYKSIFASTVDKAAPHRCRGAEGRPPPPLSHWPAYPRVCQRSGWPDYPGRARGRRANRPLPRGHDVHGYVQLSLQPYRPGAHQYHPLLLALQH